MDDPFVRGPGEVFIQSELHDADALELDENGELVAWQKIGDVIPEDGR